MKFGVNTANLLLSVTARFHNRNSHPLWHCRNERSLQTERTSVPKQTNVRFDENKRSFHPKQSHVLHETKECFSDASQKRMFPFFRLIRIHYFCIIQTVGLSAVSRRFFLPAESQ